MGGAGQANERYPQRARLLLHALIGPATLEAGREWEWRAPPTAPRVPPAALAPSFSCCAPGTGRAQAALRIAHAGGAAVFVGWGSGLPLAAGTRTSRVSRGAAWERGGRYKRRLWVPATGAYHPGRHCPAGRESWPPRSVQGEELSAAGGSAVRSERAVEGWRCQELQVQGWRGFPGRGPPSGRASTRTPARVSSQAAEWPRPTCCCWALPTLGAVC